MTHTQFGDTSEVIPTVNKSTVKTDNDEFINIPVNVKSRMASYT